MDDTLQKGYEYEIPGMVKRLDYLRDKFIEYGWTECDAKEWKSLKEHQEKLEEGRSWQTRTFY